MLIKANEIQHHITEPAYSITIYLLNGTYYVDILKNKIIETSATFYGTNAKELANDFYQQELLKLKGY